MNNPITEMSLKLINGINPIPNSRIILKEADTKYSDTIGALVSKTNLHSPDGALESLRATLFRRIENTVTNFLLEASQHDQEIENRILNRTLPYDVGFAGTALYPIWRISTLFSEKIFLIRDVRFKNKIALFTIPRDQIENLLTVTVRVGEVSIKDSGDKDIIIDLPINIRVELHPDAKYVSTASLTAS
jgi:hypothetical protein